MCSVECHVLFIGTEAHGNAEDLRSFCPVSVTSRSYLRTWRGCRDGIRREVAVDIVVDHDRRGDSAEAHAAHDLEREAAVLGGLAGLDAELPWLTASRIALLPSMWQGGESQSRTTYLPCGLV